MSHSEPSAPPANDELLRECAQGCGGAAFRVLVERHAGLVRATAWRQTGDFHAAEDIAQTVFCALLRDAGKVRGATLAAWLHRRTLYEAMHWRRTEIRRSKRERIAHDRYARSQDQTGAPPALDSALNVLRDEDREMLLLRCVDRRDWRSIGAVMGLTDDAAQKRVARAIEKVRRVLAAHGVVKSGSALTGIIALSAAAPASQAFGSPAQLAATALTNAGTAAAAPASSSLGSMLTALGMPVVMLATGITLPLAIAKKSEVRSSQPIPAVETAPVHAASSASSFAGAAPDAAALRAMLREHDSPLDRLRVRRALSTLNALACQTLSDEFTKAPGARAAEHQFYAVLRNETEERWIQADPRHAALSGYLQNNSFPPRAVRYLAARDFSAAQTLASDIAADAALRGNRMNDPFLHELVSGLASADVNAALALVESHGKGYRSTILQSAVESQPEEVLRLVASEKQEYSELDLWRKGLNAIARTDPHRALTIYRSREFPDNEAQFMEQDLMKAMMDRAPELAEREALRLHSFEPALGAFLAKRDASAAIAFANKYPGAKQGLEEALVFPDPAAALKRWSPASAEPVERWLWWRAATVCLGWLARDTQPASRGAARELTEEARAAVQEVLEGMKQFAASAGEPDPLVAGLLAQVQGLDPASAIAMADLIPDKWGAAGAKIRTDWLQQSGAAPDEVERETSRTLTRENTASGYFEFASQRMQTKPESALAWARSLSGEAKLGALAGVAGYGAKHPEAARAALNDLLALNRPDHPLVARALQWWTAGQLENDPEETSKKVAALPRGPLFDAAADGLGRALSEAGDSESALQWAAAIGDALRRNLAIQHVMDQWRSRTQSGSPAGVREAFDNLKVSAQVKQQLIRRFAP